ncbi:MAG: hypothetical protein JWO98_75 [Frankiales bacterium]|nr:hypothetical protein [Frankiales bacterium]
MTTAPMIDRARFLHEQLAQASPDRLRQMLTTFINTLMSAEADAVCGAEYGARSAERTNVRNGYRSREFDTRDVAIPKLPSGSYFPNWLLERRRRAGRALTTVVDLQSARGEHPADGAPDPAPGHHPALEVPGQQDGPRS